MSSADKVEILDAVFRARTDRSADIARICVELGLQEIPEQRPGRRSFSKDKLYLSVDVVPPQGEIPIWAAASPTGLLPTEHSTYIYLRCPENEYHTRFLAIVHTLAQP